jgi:hypothetical protein
MELPAFVKYLTIFQKKDYCHSDIELIYSGLTTGKERYDFTVTDGSILVTVTVDQFLSDLAHLNLIPGLSYRFNKDFLSLEMHHIPPFKDLDIYEGYPNWRKELHFNSSMFNSQPQNITVGFKYLDLIMQYYKKIAPYRKESKAIAFYGKKDLAGFLLKDFPNIAGFIAGYKESFSYDYFNDNFIESDNIENERFENLLNVEKSFLK